MDYSDLQAALAAELELLAAEPGMTLAALKRLRREVRYGGDLDPADRARLELLINERIAAQLGVPVSDIPGWPLVPDFPPEL